MGQDLRISTLGGLSITLGGKRIAFSTRKAEALLVYLVCHQRELPRELLATLLWEEQSQIQALTSLRAALVNLRKYLGPYLLATRTTIGITGMNIWLDVEEFQQHLKAGALDPAVALYEGEFMEGFYLKGSTGFENWLAMEREEMRRLYHDGLHELVSRSLSQRQFEAGLAYVQRLLRMDALDEAAQRKMMLLLTYSGQRTAALSWYENSRRLLLEELGIEPEEETKSLYVQIKAGPLPETLPQAHLAPAVEPLPPAFADDTQERFYRTSVVARETELKQLLTYLSQALNQQGQIVFVTGSAGQGKTTLLNEFAQQAMENHQRLLVASGSCNNFAGIGDSYLPFRDVMTMLTGDVESRWASGTISREHALRLWNALPITIQALLEYGNHLFDLFIPGSELISRAIVAGFRSVSWLKQLEESVEQQKVRQEEIKQSHLFEQFTNVLCALAKTQPLLITLDDFQWADPASISLLFHLGRRIKGAQVIVVCSYRPEEVALRRGADRHPLEKVLAELKREFGDVWIELDKSGEASHRQFVDAILDSEPNNLEEEFRTTLFEHTNGHPLFIVELLREMQERGDLIQAEGKWITGKSLDWRTLPARVDAVIEERIGRLDSELQEILTVASVEGEEFTAQVIANVRETEVRKLIFQMSQELIKLHRLVKQTNVNQVGNSRLFRYRFHHFFFQKHLYDKLEPIQREILHQEVANALEELYGKQAGEIAPQLAYHYRKSGDQEKAKHYLAKAGFTAQAKYANQEAIGFFTQALDLTHLDELETRFELLLAREKVYSLQGNREAQASDLAVLEQLARNLDDPARNGEVALRKANYALLISDYQASIADSQQVVEYALQIGDQEREANGQLVLGYALLSQGEYEPASLHLTTALEIAQSLHLYQLAGECNERLGFLKQSQGEELAAKEHYRQSSQIYARLGNRLGEAYALNSLGTIDQAFWNYNEATDKFEQALKMFREIGELLGEAYVLNNLGLNAVYQGDFTQAQIYHECALSIFQRIEHPFGQGVSLNNLGEAFCYLEEYQRGKDYYMQALIIFQKSGNRPAESYALTGLGDTSFGLGELEEAKSYYQRATELDQELGQTTHLMEVRAGLARVALTQGALDEARFQVSEILGFLEGGHTLGTQLSPFRVYWTCYQVLHSSNDPKAGEVLENAHRQLQEWAAKIIDSVAQHSFLENIPWNREIVKAYNEYTQNSSS
jgi:DNA-binding SARP family transcriptional activator/predicted ATPase